MDSQNSHRQPSTWLPLILCLIVVLALLVVRDDAPGERAYAVFQSARDRTGPYSPLFVLPLSLAARLGLPVAQAGVLLSVIGWLATLVAVYGIGLRSNRPVIAVLAAAALTIEPSFYQLLGQDGLFVMGWLWAALANIKYQISNIKTWMAGLMLIVLAAAALAQIRIAPALTVASYGPTWIAGLVLLGGWALDRVIAFVTRWPPMYADKNVLVASLAVIALVGFGYARGSNHLLERTPFAEQRLALWKQAGGWLKQNARPDATVWSDAPNASGALGYFAERRIVPAGAPDAAPDYAVAVNSLAWAQRLSQPWFQEHYRRVYAIANSYDSLAPLGVYRYRPSPFDLGSDVRVDARLGESIELSSYRLDSTQLIPGEAQHLTLTWRALEPLSRTFHARVRLYEAATRRVWAQVDHATPANLKTRLWPVGRALTDRYTLEIPDDLPNGAFQIEAQMLYAENEALVAPNLDHPLGAAVTLARLEAQPWTSGAPLTAARPLTATFGDSIELIGYGLRPANDAAPIVERGGGLRVRLYWHARTAPGADYHVFTHLLTADDRLVAQSDSVPVYGTLPTDHWPAGQYILDEHLMAIGADAPPGRYWLKIGLYTADNGERLVARDAAGRELPERSLPLVQVEVE